MPDITISLTKTQATRVRGALRHKFAGDEVMSALSDTDLAKAFVKDTLRNLVLDIERSILKNKMMATLDDNFD